MKIVQINVTCGQGSTGKICFSVSELLDENNIENRIIYSQGYSDYKNAVKVGNAFYYKLQALKSRVLGNYGFNSRCATKKLIKVLKDFSPDVVHLHNIHGHNCDLGLLFKYLKKEKIKVFWTLHDCWSFTGYCVYFTMVKCNKWKTECNKCPQRKEFSWFFDKSRKLFNRKKELFTGLDMTIITPSKWLADLVKQSFLKDYPVMVINNGIDLSVFKPTGSNFKEKYSISQEKFVLLGVAFGWGRRKGFDVFIELYNRLDKSKYQIVLVGTDDKVDKLLPKEIISIHRTQNQTELAEIYTAADLFVNPTREEVLGLVNIEANACGTPVITFRTGGSPECIDVKSGMVVECDDVDSLCRGIELVREKKMFSNENCEEQVKVFDKNKKFREYVDLYNEYRKED